MLTELPLYISLLFIFTTLVTFVFLIAAMKNVPAKSRAIISIVLIAWLLLHAILAMRHFYTITYTVPPRFAFLVLPPFIIILIVFITKNGRRFIDGLSPEILTRLHVVRLFVEIILFWLFLYKYVPRLMTFEGRNFDILAGITAPVIAYYGIQKRMLGRTFLLTWNFISLLLLLNIVINAVLSAPFPFQQFGFDQPNVAILYFPFIWLPGFIVPAVFFAHAVLIRRLLKRTF
ncbi:MAG: hypothetical protein ABJA57_05545 [Ginsengibacter sp.]